jgi:dihydroxy-acid dehydratase
MGLRSARWYSGDDRNSYIHRAWMRRGLPADAFDGERPHIAIANTASDLTPCNSHLDEVADSVKQGVWAAGGVPLNLPVVSLGLSHARTTPSPRCSWPPPPSTCPPSSSPAGPC